MLKKFEIRLLEMNNISMKYSLKYQKNFFMKKTKNEKLKV